MVGLTKSDRRIPGRLIEWSHNNLRDYPWRDTRSISPYRILLAELLLKRTTATSVARVYESFVSQYPDFKQLSLASEQDLQSSFKPVGLHKQRARSTFALSQYLAASHSGAVPNTLSELLKVPGIGPYSSRAILSFGFDEPNAIVDGNVQRIFQRVFGARLLGQISVDACQNIADRLLPKHSHRQFNFGLLDLGSLICRPVIPKCNICPLSDMCDYSCGRSTEGMNEEDTLGQRLRKARTSQGISLVRLALMSGVSKTSLINLEHGRTTPTNMTMRKISNVLPLAVT